MTGFEPVTVGLILRKLQSHTLAYFQHYYDETITNQGRLTAELHAQKLRNLSYSNIYRNIMILMG